MGEKLSKEEQFIVDVMKEVFDLDLKKIPKSNAKSPDFLTTDGTFSILLELKTKFESKETLAKRELALNQEEIYSESTPLCRRNTISKRIRESASQLAIQKEKENADFSFVVLHAIGPAEASHIEQFKASLYGSRNIVVFNSKDVARVCYYYENSEFFRHKSIIDGALIIGEDKATLCLNDLSPNYSRIKQSDFAERFYGGTIDPREKEASGKAFIADTNIDRNDKESINQYLCKKYSLPRIIDFNFVQYTVISRIPNSDSDPT